MENKDHGIRIIGSGCAGMGAAWQLHNDGQKPIVYEAHDYTGGHTYSHVYEDGFVFDEGPHVSFTKNSRFEALLAESVDQDFQAFEAKVNNYWQGHWIKHPAQVNLAGLPIDTIVSCIKDFIHAQHNEYGEINDYQDWLHAAFGPTFADTFPGQYTKKYHTTEPKNLTTDWLGPRLYQPDIGEVLHGALTKETPDVHYIPHYRYPTHGGFVSYLKQFEDVSDIRTGHRVTAIDMAEKRLSFSNGNEAGFEQLISSIPLPALIPLIKNAPQEILDAAALLSCSQVVIVNIGLKCEPISDQSWTYFYDDEFPFSRLSFPGNYSPHTVPEGCCSVQAEIYFSDKWKPRTGELDDWIQPTIDGLIECGLIKDESDIIHKSTIYAPWGNVIFDHDRPRCLKLVHDYLKEIGIAWCGRYGDWAYIWTDESFISGERAANMVMKRLSAGE